MFFKNVPFGQDILVNHVKQRQLQTTNLYRSFQKKEEEARDQNFGRITAFSKFAFSASLLELTCGTIRFWR